MVSLFFYTKFKEIYLLPLILGYLSLDVTSL